MALSRENVRRWIAGRQAAAEREKQELRERSPTTEESVQIACELIALTGRIHGWPGKADSITEREDRDMYRQWKKLRTRWNDG